MNKEKIQKLVFLGIIGLLIISLCFNVHYYRALEKTGEEVKVVVKEKIDTIRDTVPQVKYVTNVKTDKQVFTEYKVKHDTVTNTEYVEVNIPITQKTYSDDSTYTAYVSGYKPNLDSIDVYKKTITIEKETTITKKDAKRWSIGPVVYGGYNFNEKQFGYGVGIGVTFGLFRW